MPCQTRLLTKQLAQLRYDKFGCRALFAVAKSGDKNPLRPPIADANRAILLLPPDVFLKVAKHACAVASRIYAVYLMTHKPR